MIRADIILASASPRRRDYLQRSQLRVEVIPVDLDEAPLEEESGTDLVARLAVEKAMAVGPVELPVVAGDTIVSCQGEILGKPQDPRHAHQMLELLSGTDHQVIGGWCVRHSGVCLRGVEISQVRFRQLDQRMIEDYVATGEPLDKAGAYGIQGLGAELVESVRGSWCNIVGLPVIPVLSALREVLGR